MKQNGLWSLWKFRFRLFAIEIYRCDIAQSYFNLLKSKDGLERTNILFICMLYECMMYSPKPIIHNHMLHFINNNCHIFNIHNVIRRLTERKRATVQWIYVISSTIQFFLSTFDFWLFFFFLFFDSETFSCISVCLILFHLFSQTRATGQCWPVGC